MSKIQAFTFRLKPNQDLFKEIETFVNEKGIEAGSILACVGSLTTATLRLASSVSCDTFKGPFEIVDGKQRLETVLRFLRNEIPVFGNNYLKDFDILPVDVDFVFNINDLKTRKEVLQWYLDLNSGGVIHTKEELDKVKELLKKEE